MSGIFVDKEHYNMAVLIKMATSSAPNAVGVLVLYLAGDSRISG